jgi:Tail-tube assembly protein
MAIEYDQLGNAISGSYDGIPTPPSPSAAIPSIPKPGKAPYTPNEFKKDTPYSVGNYMYPSDLMADDGRYGGNYVIFYINVVEDSKLFNDTSIETVNDLTPRDSGDLAAMKLNDKQLITGNAAVNTITGLAGGSIVGKSVTGALKGAAVANIPTVGVGIAATLAPEAKRSKKRLKTAIALHIPNQLSIRYGMQWNEDDTAALAMAAVGSGEIMKAMGDGGSMKDVTDVGTAIIANIALSKGPMAAANSKALGLAANPKKEQIFKGVDFRTFAFDYQFYPRSAEEAQNVLRIIEQFKYHMHPEFKDTNNFIYVYPSEFDVFYYQGTKENMNLHRHTSCVLSEMNVNYTPNGSFTTFANGMPTQINVTLSFKELALLSKEKIKDGL